MAGFDPISAGFNALTSIVDKIFPDKTEAERIKAELVKQQMSGGLEEFKTMMEVYIAEAKSVDKWTSRARPSFLYLMYLMIAFGIPMGLLSVFNPGMATQVATGMQAWLTSIPDMLWGVFGASFSVYTVSRSVWDKRIGQK